jgi:hypothetical protein
MLSGVNPCKSWLRKTTPTWRSCSRGLREEAYEVQVAGDGKTALEITRNQTFDVVLLDVMSPGIIRNTEMPELILAFMICWGHFWGHLDCQFEAEWGTSVLDRFLASYSNDAP